MPQQNFSNILKELTARYLSSPALSRLNEVELSVAQYKQVLLEIYCTLRETRRSKALASVHLRGIEHQSVQTLLNHKSISQKFIDLAQNDLRALGALPANLVQYHPLPSTMGLISYPFYQLNFENPLGYLGYLHVIEQLPAASHNTLGRAARAAGVPAEAMTFFQNCFDEQSSKFSLRNQTIEAIANSPIEREAIESGMKTTVGLYTSMISEAINSNTTTQQSNASLPAPTTPSAAATAGKSTATTT